MLEYLTQKWVEWGMTLSPELREPTSYASEPVEPYVSEMEIVNDYARFFLRKGETASLQVQIDKYSELYRRVLVDVEAGRPTTEAQLAAMLAKCEEKIKTLFEKETGLFLGQPLVLWQYSAFATISITDTTKGQWARVPESWQLHGELGQPSTVWQRRESAPGQGNTLLSPGVFLTNPVLITEKGSPLELGEQFVIKIALADSNTVIQEGVYHEPSTHDDEL